MVHLLVSWFSVTLAFSVRVFAFSQLVLSAFFLLRGLQLSFRMIAIALLQPALAERWVFSLVILFSFLIFNFSAFSQLGDRIEKTRAGGRKPQVFQ